MSDTANRFHKWIWISIYGGMFLLALGLSVQRRDAVLGWGIASPGIAAIVIGFVLIWVRSRTKNTNERE